MSLTSLESNSSQVRAPDPQSADDCEIVEALWAAYRPYDKSAVTKQLLRRYLTAAQRWLRMKKIKIVIASGDVAGRYVAKHFDKHLACHADLEVTPIGRENFVLFTPRLREVAGGDLFFGTEIEQTLTLRGV